MAKQQELKKKTTASSDTTVIKKPYKAMANELIGSISNAKKGKIIDLRKGLPLADSSVKKMKYNREVALPSTLKRNAERLKEGKKPIPYTGRKDNVNALGIGLSNKGKTFKEAPLKYKKVTPNKK